MTDNKSLQARHRNMAAVRSENTRPEILVRRTLFFARLSFPAPPKRSAGLS